MSMLFQFLLLATWFAMYLTSGILYEMVVNVLYFEFPAFLLLFHSLSSLFFMQLAKKLNISFTKSWKNTIDLKAFVPSMMLSLSIFLSFMAFYKDTPSSNLLQYVMAPLVLGICVNLNGSSKKEVKHRVILSILSVFVTFYTTKRTVFTSSGLYYGLSMIVSTATSFYLLRRYLQKSSPSQFLYSHFSFSILVFFIHEIYQHEIHNIILYITVWQMPNFYSVMSSFLLSFSVFLLFLCHTLTHFDFPTMYICLNTKSAFQFVIVNYIYEHTAKKKYYPNHNSSIFGAALDFFIAFSAYWIFAKRRCEN